MSVGYAAHFMTFFLPAMLIFSVPSLFPPVKILENVREEVFWDILGYGDFLLNG